jgi:hypothetical protein
VSARRLSSEVPRLTRHHVDKQLQVSRRSHVDKQLAALSARVAVLQGARSLHAHPLSRLAEDMSELRVPGAAPGMLPGMAGLLSFLGVVGCVSVYMPWLGLMLDVSMYYCALSRCSLVGFYS